MSDIYDIVIVGGGPGGMSAGIYGSRSRLKTVILQKGRLGGQAATTEELENYPGFGRGTTGPELMQAMADHAESFGTEIVRDEVVDLSLNGDVKLLTTKSGQVYKAKTVILALGAEPRSLNIRGENKFRGKGVSYCATCDADFFEELDVIVVGNGDAAVEEAMYLTKFAETVTIIVIHDEGILDCNQASAEKAMANPKIKWVWSSVLQEVKGDGLVESVVIKNIKTGELTEMQINGVFFFVGTVPKTELLKGQVDLDEQGYVITNEQMETSVAGVYAVGDCRVKYLRQVVTAASDGAIAAVAADKYLAEEEDFKVRVLNVKEPVWVAFWAPQVEASINAIADLEQWVAKTGTNVKLVKIDTYRNQRLVERYAVDEIPSALLFHKGELISKLSGSFSPEDLDNQMNLAGF
ncbi:Thioredoxin reductase [Syntrophomonas zehnderi OL-4]|uniref:Thioredoxin reductase n=1 Tax=Syntrophomonas zehnderi OL-4 TaxID=690567 RepID=A0A0E4GC42_9FIRM|nr:thioredoxin-disulfide reductase [Syntrophomonas zehnderi]CFX88931.1 Thioredoxin reductase [Syntrophomonas zehnderi OL-4]